MTNQDTWGDYIAIPWDGTPIADGTFVAFRSTEYDIGLDGYFTGRNSLAGFMTTTPFRWNNSEQVYDYLTVDMPATGVGCVFKINTWPRVPDEIMAGNNPGNYQKITLQTANSNYVMMGEDGCFISSANQDNASVFVLDLDRGTQTLLYPVFYRYSQRVDMDARLSSVFFSDGSYSVRFVKPSASQPIVFMMKQGKSYAGIMNIVIMKRRPLSNGMHVKLPDGTFYLVLDNQLRRIADVPVYTNLFKNLTTIPISSPINFNYKVGADINRSIYLATGTPAGNVFLIIDGFKRLIINQSVFDKYGFNPNNIKALNTHDLSAIPNGQDLT